MSSVIQASLDFNCYHGDWSLIPKTSEEVYALLSSLGRADRGKFWDNCCALATSVNRHLDGISRARQSIVRASALEYADKLGEDALRAIGADSSHPDMPKSIGRYFQGLGLRTSALTTLRAKRARHFARWFKSLACPTRETIAAYWKAYDETGDMSGRKFQFQLLQPGERRMHRAAAAVRQRYQLEIMAERIRASV